MKLISRNESFQCFFCGNDVEPRRPSDNGPGGIRNHCPVCLCSLHVDDLLPGDRKSQCNGIMKPSGYRRKHKEEQILQICDVCQKQHWNTVAPDDNREMVIDLSSRPFPGNNEST